MLGVGFIGLGNMGRHQVRSFQQVPGVRIVAGADVSEASRQQFAPMAPGASLHEHYATLLEDRAVDAVVIAVPTGFHAEVTTGALSAGKHVLVEKSMARTVEECRAMIDAAQCAKKVLMVAHCRRYDEDWGTFAKIYRTGELGAQVLWRNALGVPSPGAWYMDDRLGGGPLFDGAIHNLDFANWLFGPAEQVVGSEIKFSPQATAVDTGSAIVRYRNGCQVLLSWSWGVRGSWLHDVMGTEATFVFGPEGQPVPEGLKGHTIIDPSGQKRLVTFIPKDMYVAQAQHFLDCIAGRAKCQSDGNESMKAVAVANAVLKACRERVVVRIAQ